ncbi:hypothetical protein [Desulfosoma sp.]|uniref:hypothetical protein n=1 Tax=Desulfosoma sp. TaxID=2603217 RepID=UPI00404AE212
MTRAGDPGFVKSRCKAGGHVSSAERALRPVILGAWGPPVLACVRSWGRRGWPVGLILVDSTNTIKPASRYLSSWCLLPRDQLGTQEGFGIVSDFVQRFRADGITCVEEGIASWLHQESQRLSSFPTRWFPDPDRLGRVLDKAFQIEIAQSVGLDVLPTVRIDPPGVPLKPLSRNLFPLCVRPALGWAVAPPFKARYVPDVLALENLIQNLSFFRCALLAQPFLAVPNLVVHGSRSASGDVLGLQAFLVPRKFEGVTLAIHPVSMTPGLEDKCCAFLKALDVLGPFHFEFLWDAVRRRAWFLEINNRFGGTTAKVLACGYDEPAYALMAFGVPVHVLPKPFNGMASSKQAIVKYLFHAAQGRLTPLDFPEETRARRVRAGIKGFWTWKDDVWASDDALGACSLYARNLFYRWKRNRR